MDVIAVMAVEDTSATDETMATIATEPPLYEWMPAQEIGKYGICGVGIWEAGTLSGLTYPKGLSNELMEPVLPLLPVGVGEIEGVVLGGVVVCAVVLCGVVLCGVVLGGVVLCGVVL